MSTAEVTSERCATSKCQTPFNTTAGSSSARYSYIVVVAVNSSVWASAKSLATALPFANSIDVDVVDDAATNNVVTMTIRTTNNGRNNNRPNTSSSIEDVPLTATVTARCGFWLNGQPGSGVLNTRVTRDAKLDVHKYSPLSATVEQRFSTTTREWQSNAQRRERVMHWFDGSISLDENLISGHVSGGSNGENSDCNQSKTSLKASRLRCE
ncbi:unnamed protein product [Ceratitis capitata]|uniref:(Mediterranean fruit fly) hypothetical protein n=1 Tax=Ceratitis capitata TaxID=7213 RepID=A0A811TW64_CERCA|nr:unnamed protein product [Ceratitis capitata]